MRSLVTSPRPKLLMMKTVRLHHDYSAPVERLFDHLAEHENLAPLFGTRTERVRDGDAERNGVGSVRRLSFGGLMPFEETVTVFVPNERIEYRISKGTPMRDHIGVMEFSSTPSGGSQLDYAISFDAAVPGLAAVVAAAVQRSVSRGLAKLGGSL